MEMACSKKPLYAIRESRICRVTFTGVNHIITITLCHSNIQASTTANHESNVIIIVQSTHQPGPVDFCLPVYKAKLQKVTLLKETIEPIDPPHMSVVLSTNLSKIYPEE